MRPNRAVVKKAIDDAKKNISRVSSLLGCTRQTAYTWIYQLGLADYAGIRMDKRSRVDKHERLDKQDALGGNEIEKGVYSSGAEGRTFRVVPTQVIADSMIPVTIRVPQSLWKAAKKKAVDEDTTVSAVVTECLETTLTPAKSGRKARNGGPE